MLCGGGGVPVHQELDGDLEGTSRPDQAQMGRACPWGPVAPPRAPSSLPLSPTLAGGRASNDPPASALTAPSTLNALSPLNQLPPPGPAPGSSSLRQSSLTPAPGACLPPAYTILGVSPSGWGHVKALRAYALLLLTLSIILYWLQVR